MDLIAPTPEQEAIISSDYNRICVFACAGSGKTFTITRKIARLLNQQGVDPYNIGAITFTKLAAESLKENLVKVIRSPKAVARIFVGTIHSFCLNLLKEGSDFQFSDNQVLTENQQYMLLSAKYNEWGIDKLLESKSKSSVIENLVTTINIIKMESIPMEVVAQLHPLVSDVLQKYNLFLFENLFWDYSDLIREVNNRLKLDDKFYGRTVDRFNYLFVDEYQDVDPLQAEIIELIGLKSNICVVGDDDQSIYQFRGTDVKNILKFSKDKDTKTFFLSQNRRCAQNIIDVSKNCIGKVRERQEKGMNSLVAGGVVKVVFYDTIENEVTSLVNEIKKLKSNGSISDYSNVAILMRSVSSYGHIYIKALKDQGIGCVVKGGRDLFQSEEIKKIVEVIGWLLVEVETRDSLQTLVRIFDTTILISEQHYTDCDCITNEQLSQIGLTETQIDTYGQLRKVKEAFFTRKYSSLMEIVHRIISALNQIHSNQKENAIFNIAQFTQIVEEYELINRNKSLGQFMSFLVYYASRAYDEHLQSNKVQNNVNIITIHQAKGLEFDYVFIPMLVEKRFPVERVEKRWLIDSSLFDNKRYENDLDNERRLFYVAATRSKLGLYLVGSADIGLSNPKTPSLFLTESVPFSQNHVLKHLKTPFLSTSKKFLITSYSKLEYYLTCPYRYKLICDYEIRLPKNPFFEFGKIIHFIVAIINKSYQNGNLIKQPQAIDQFNEIYTRLYRDANVPHFVLKRQQLRGIKAVTNYYTRQTWITKSNSVEEDFELIRPNFIVKGRFDLIWRSDDDSYNILDIKTGQPHDYLRTDFQMQLYFLAASMIFDGIIDTASLYYIEKDEVVQYKVNADFITGAEANLDYVTAGILNGRFDATPGEMCNYCEVRQYCQYKR